MPYPCSSPGALAISTQELLVFGGYNADNLTTSFALVQDGENSFRVDAERVGELAEADIFLFTGAVRMDLRKGEVAICGKSFVHVLNEREKTFSRLMKVD